MKKNLILCGVFTIITFVIIMTGVVMTQQSKEEKRKNIISESQSNKMITCVDNQIIVTLTANSTKEYAHQIASDINAKVILEMEEFQDYVLEFENHKFNSEEEITNYCDELENKYSEIEICSCNRLYSSDS